MENDGSIIQYDSLKQKKTAVIYQKYVMNCTQEHPSKRVKEYFLLYLLNLSVECIWLKEEIALLFFGHFEFMS